MPLVTTLASDLILLIRERTNMENNQFITDDELLNYLNGSLAMLDTYLINQFSDYKITSLISNVQFGTVNQIPLPDDFLKLRGVDVWYNLSSQDGYRILGEHSFQQRNRKPYLNSGSAYGPMNLTYRLQGENIVIEPATFASQWTYRLWYTPQYVPMVGTGDPVQPYMDGQFWTEYAVADCCVKVLAKQDLDPSVFMQQAAELKEYIVKLATPNRNSGEPKYVVDSRSDDGSWIEDPGFW